MKLLIISLAISLFSQLSFASPTPTEREEAARAKLVKRATITDAANLGYATQNGGTTGGKGGTVTTVSTLAQFSAVADNSKNNDATPRIIVVKGTISGATQVRIGSNKSIIGLPGAKFEGISLFIWKQSNVIVRNIISANVLASSGDGLTIQASNNVWIDHCEFYSDLNHDKDYYDGLVDASLIGHSDNNPKDAGHLHVTQAYNYWENIGSRTPSFRYGTGHIYNSYFKNMKTGIDTRDGAQILIQSNVFRNVTQPIAALYSDVTGYANVFDVDLGGASNTAPVGKLTASSMPYSYSLLGSGSTVSSVMGTVGATLTF
ncbi:hypothetical protein HYALB_00012816 [Hymenoscyphus albidus]|uniref:Pectate lyase domain-containing protein n=1 Tax=Hymenoscyphus albidus TaxID=595503 RepID=A0A9N9LSV7_9HELO|nr:hypothetical protein HYALB_00012816 [Hymenoscyphus albidus]